MLYTVMKTNTFFLHTSGQENIDPLDAVAAANHNQESNSYTPDPATFHNQPRPPNHRSIFGQDLQEQHHDATAALLQNAERISPMRENPNVFRGDPSQQMTVDSVRSNELQYESEGYVADIPPEQRLFASGSAGSSSQLMYQQPGRGGNQANNRGRQPNTSSAPPTGGNYHDIKDEPNMFISH